MTVSVNTNISGLTAADKAGIMSVIADVFKRSGAKHEAFPFDMELWAGCMKECRERAFPVEPQDIPGKVTFRRSLKVGVVIAQTSYRHLADFHTRVWIAMFTGLVTYADDVFQKDIRHLQSFPSTFVTNGRHENPVLDALASYLREVPARFGDFVANLVISSCLRFMMSASLEFDGQDVAVSSDAKEYAHHVRLLSGLPDIYAIFVFPPKIPRSAYIQAFPEQMEYINMTNDVLSFYKEELEGETSNFISATATSQNSSKLEILRVTAEKAIACHEATLKILEPCPEASAAWKSFASGFCAFHSASPRYKLDELLN
ncbi:terpenoid synthase [Coprinopsis marcescibilis]|uniref:Terpenoid synthase n=1 Tax=Coprinopsis marcescibilis TaxID=230819 RepID=A0A5C3L0T0_COPMA|nr:terpenoid synthase [Coprinopsis marcescibilis]